MPESSPQAPPISPSPTSAAIELYLKELNSDLYEPLEKEEELRLARCMRKGDLKAREKLIQANLRFVVRVALRYNNGILPLEDLIGIGNEGLMRAVETFDPSRGIKFISYAVWRIREALLSTLYDERVIRLPRNRVGELIRILRLKDLYEADSPEELGEKLHLHPTLVKKLLHITQPLTSLQAPNHEGVRFGAEGIRTLLDVLPDEQSPDANSGALLKDLQEALHRALETLSDREREILEYHYGLEGKPRLWLSEIGERFGVSKERIRKIEERALMSLRQEHQEALREYLDLEG